MCRRGRAEEEILWNNSLEERTTNGKDVDIFIKFIWWMHDKWMVKLTASVISHFLPVSKCWDSYIKPHSAKPTGQSVSFFFYTKVMILFFWQRNLRALQTDQRDLECTLSILLCRGLKIEPIAMSCFFSSRNCNYVQYIFFFYLYMEDQSCACTVYLGLQGTPVSLPFLLHLPRMLQLFSPSSFTKSKMFLHLVNDPLCLTKTECTPSKTSSCYKSPGGGGQPSWLLKTCYFHHTEVEAFISINASSAADSAVIEDNETAMDGDTFLYLTFFLLHLNIQFEFLYVKIQHVSTWMRLYRFDDIVLVSYRSRLTLR